jgi:hypothetical protein
MKQAEEDLAGRAFSTVMLSAFAVCLGWLCFRYLFLPWAADDGLAALDGFRGMRWLFR